MVRMSPSLEFDVDSLDANDRQTIGMYEELVDKRKNRGRASADEECHLQGLKREIAVIRNRLKNATPN